MLLPPTSCSVLLAYPLGSLLQTTPLSLDRPVCRCYWQAWSCAGSHPPRPIHKPGHRTHHLVCTKPGPWSGGHSSPLTFGPRSESWVEANTHWQSGEQRRLVGLLGNTLVLESSCSWGTVSAYRTPSAEATCTAKAVVSTRPLRPEGDCSTASLLGQCHFRAPETNTFRYT